MLKNRKYKVRLIPKGFIQKEGIDIFTRCKIYFCQNFALINGDQDEVIYTSQSKGFEIESNSGRVYLLIKSLYGLK